SAHAAFHGEMSADNYAPLLSATGQPVTAQRLRDHLASAGVAVLGPEDARPPAQSDQGGWSEIGQIDALGHSLGVRLPKQIETEVDAIADRVMALVEGGWPRVKVVTDHGWLLLPGGLPK